MIFHDAGSFSDLAFERSMSKLLLI